jgi:hypothetical protein
MGDAASQADREMYQRQIDATDREIDKLVYELPKGTDGGGDQGGGGEVRDQTGKICLTLVLTESVRSPLTFQARECQRQGDSTH